MADRSSNTNRPLKPTLASSRVPRAPLTPRLGPSASPSTRPTGSKTPSTVSVPARTTPRAKQDTTSKTALPTVNITPRSSVRKLRGEGTQTSPNQDGPPSSTRSRTTTGSAVSSIERSRTVGGLGISGLQPTARAKKPRSVVNGDSSSGTPSPPLAQSPGRFDLYQTDESIDSRFFHASEAPKQAAAPTIPELKKPAAFFYADGQQEEQPKAASRAPSPALSAAFSTLSEKRSSAPWNRPDAASYASTKSPPMLSPTLSSLSSASPLFAATAGQPPPRSPSPNRENIHLSYRKGASQIFGKRPAPQPIVDALPGERREVTLDTVPVATPHRKSPSLSSIDSSNSPQSKRRSATIIGPASSPLTHEVSSTPMPRLGQPPNGLSHIDTSLSPSTPDVRSGAELPMSPTKSVMELAADARRERKVLDLEISNSSLLAINASLEREMRRQKAELKRFRRLSRAGRFSFSPDERATRLPEHDGEDGEYDGLEQLSGFSDVYDDFSDETESVLSGGEPLSPGAQANKDGHRLAKDEKRLRVDLEKHKELLVHTQMMNQSLKRCMCATEEMIRDGKKALQYHVRVSDVKIGGRVLSGHEDESDGREQIEVEDDMLHGDEGAHDAKPWPGGGRPSCGSSEGGDRDSGIEADRPSAEIHSTVDTGAPPD